MDDCKDPGKVQGHTEAACLAPGLKEREDKFQLHLWLYEYFARRANSPGPMNKRKPNNSMVLLYDGGGYMRGTHFDSTALVAGVSYMQMPSLAPATAH